MVIRFRYGLRTSVRQRPRSFAVVRPKMYPSRASPDDVRVHDTNPNPSPNPSVFTAVSLGYYTDFVYVGPAKVSNRSRPWNSKTRSPRPSLIQLGCIQFSSHNSSK